jgi:hypothetical protein
MRSQPRHGQFIVHGAQGPRHCSSLEEARAEAERLAREGAQVLAIQAGAETVEVRIDEAADHVVHDIDGELFLEARIMATATGRPAPRSAI